MPANPPLPPDQEEIRSHYVEILKAWLTEQTNGAPGSFDHEETDGKLTGFHWATDDRRQLGFVDLKTLDEYMNRFTVTFHGGINHDMVTTGQGQPKQKMLIRRFQRPTIYNNFTGGEESTLYELRIVNDQYEYHAVQSWDVEPPADALDS